MFVPNLSTSMIKKTMNILIICAVFCQPIFLNVKAQHPILNPHNPQDSQSGSSFQPSLVVVIGILSIMFSLTFLLLFYAKFCHTRTSMLNSTPLQIPQAGSMRRSSGIDKTLVESLPFFRFSALKGAREGLECAVCLARFEDIEILRLLPKCKHAFHIGCIDLWLERHSSCPLCRHKVSAEDLSFSTSLRFLDQSELRQESSCSSSLGLYIQRQESSRYKTIKNEEKLPMKQNHLHHLNHRIIVSDVVLKNRWSNLSSSDLMALTSELIRDVTSNRFSSLDNRNMSYQQPDHEDESQTSMNIREEMERKRLLEMKIKQNQSSFPNTTTSAESVAKLVSQNEKRCMSEIVVHPRFTDFNNFGNGNLQDSADDGRNVSEERRRNLWLPIARRTAQWFAKRERRGQLINPNTQNL